jgi:acetyl esterase/lipase
MIEQGRLNQSLVFKTTPTRDLLVDIFPSPTPAKGCIAFLHGGALLLGSRGDLPKAVTKYLNGQGWDVAALDYRLISECPISEIAEDINDGCAFVRSKYDSKPFLLSGYSAGAYLALLHGAQKGSPDGIIAFAGYGDLGADWYFSPSQFFVDYKNVDYVAEKIAASQPFESLEERIDLYVYLRQKGQWPQYVLGERTLDQEIQAWSPMRHLKASFPRTVLIHGDGDCDVPVDTSVQMSRALTEHDIPHKLIVLEGLDHDLFEQIDRPEVASAWKEALELLSA